MLVESVKFHSSCLTDLASAATDIADRQRRATESRRQNATELRNAQLSVVSCKRLVASDAHRRARYVLAWISCQPCIGTTFSGWSR